MNSPSFEESIMFQWVARYLAVTAKPGALQLLAMVLGGGVVVLTFPSSALAYLDPVSGSFYLQLLLGGLAGAVVIAKIYWQRFQLFFKRPAKSTERGQNTRTGT
jgi:hypothetical protein